ncbi:MAG: hypothetical protein ACJARZ_001297 [Dokdonia sp.]|jgi:hypothetical protein
MKFLNNLWVAGLFCMFLSCDSQDDNLAAEEALALPSFKGLSFAEEGLLEYTYTTGNEEASFRNLTQVENYPTQFEFVHHQRGVFGLYRGQNVWMRDVMNSTTEQFLDYTSPGNSERREGVVNDDLHIALLYRRQDALDQLQLRIVNAQNNVQKNVNFGMVSGFTYSYLYENTVIITLENEFDNSTSLFVIDVESGVVRSELTFFNTRTTGLAFGNNNNFYFFDGQGKYHHYDLASLNLIETVTTDFAVQSGSVYEVYDGMLIGNFFYLQPSFFNKGPLLVDLTTQTSVQVDIGAALTNFLGTRENGERIANSDFVYDRDSETWLANYSISFSTGQGEAYGVVQINALGEIVNSISTAFPITRVVVD